MIKSLEYIKIHILKEGEKPVLLSELENKIVAWALHLPEKIQISHCNSKENSNPIKFIGGREYRSLGDTCRMFCKMRLQNRMFDYFFWDGIVKVIHNDYDYFSEEYYAFKNSFYYYIFIC